MPSAVDVGTQEASASRLAGSQAWEFRRVKAKHLILQSRELSNCEFLRNLSSQPLGHMDPLSSTPCCLLYRLPPPKSPEASLFPCLVSSFSSKVLEVGFVHSCVFSAEHL